MTTLTDDQRLWACCGLAALLHLALLFGLRIGAEPVMPHSLDVTLVTLPDGSTPLAANVIAPVAHTGGGGYRDLRAQESYSTGRMDLNGLRQGTDLAMRAVQQPTGSPPVVSSTAPSNTLTRASDEAPQTGSDAALQLLRREQAGLGARSADRNQLAQTPSEHTAGQAAGVSTRADRQAAYREAWRRQVERAGVNNFPWSALTLGKSQSLTLAVTVSADGSVAQVRILRSSGLPTLDKAALDILRAAAPFPAFPEHLRQESAEMSFAYEWEFLPGNRAALRIGR